MSAIVDIKYCNMVVEILITHSDKVFSDSPLFPRSPSNSGGLAFGGAPVPAIAAAAVVATAPAAVNAIGPADVSVNIPVSQSSGSASTPSASQSDTTSDCDHVSPDADLVVGGAAIKKPPSSSASHSSLVSVSNLAPVTHVS